MILTNNNIAWSSSHLSISSSHQISTSYISAFAAFSDRHPRQFERSGEVGRLGDITAIFGGGGKGREGYCWQVDESPGWRESQAGARVIMSRKMWK